MSATEATKGKRRKTAASKKFVVGYLMILAIMIAAYVVLGYLAVLQKYEGNLYFLQWPMTGLTAAGAFILPAYFKKSKAENTAGGIIYDTAMNTMKEETL